LRYDWYGGVKLRHPMWCIITYLQDGGTQVVLTSCWMRHIGLKTVTFDLEIRSSANTGDAPTCRDGFAEARPVAN
jgi:hypothetical protein